MRELVGGKAARSVATLIAALALVFALNACGDDDEESGDDSAAAEESADATNVTVTATEYDFELSATPTAETDTVTLDNQGEKFHVMVYARINEGFTLDEVIQMQGEKGSATTLAEAEAEPGQSVDVPVEKAAEPGSYVMLCPIEDEDGRHFELGQLEEFEIE